MNDTPKQISALRGKLKAKKRAIKTMNRYEARIEAESLKYELMIAAQIRQHLG